MSSQILLTGVTGFLGMELLQRLLAHDPNHHLFLLVRSSRSESAQERVQGILGNLNPRTLVEPAGSRVETIEGDIALDRFGLDPHKYDALARRITHIIHCAATVRFDLSLDEARRTNTQGTHHMLDFAERCVQQGHLDRFDYIGTSYVAGQRRGIIKESELDCGQAFANSYEQSKFEAERRVREYVPRLPITIFRPSIIVGNSQTGSTASFQGAYKPLRLYVKRLIVCIPADKATPVDIVPVDYVADSVCYLIEHQSPHGECYHITAGLDRTSTIGELVKQTEQFFKIPAPRLISLSTYRRFIRPILWLLLTGAKRKAMYNGEFYLPYLSSQLQFDNSNTVRDLKGSGLVAPRPEAYFMKMLQFCQESDFGREPL
ncbi:MAG: SDR family oxidoreductase [Acidobacteria bacterium]|nr:SDR family oxidoreductase [Acidobacteriota bacterium]MBI3657177.1 SDR family oxidoreductase [Acidobacteriota bacterium]